MGVTPFVELRAHTAFSFGDGAVTPEALAARAAELGYPALGLTDTADFGGIPRFVLEAERRGVKPVIGAELPVDGRPMAFLVESEEGYRNLAALVTRARVGELDGWEREHPPAQRGKASLDLGSGGRPQRGAHRAHRPALGRARRAPPGRPA